MHPAARLWIWEGSPLFLPLDLGRRLVETFNLKVPILKVRLERNRALSKESRPCASVFIPAGCLPEQRQYFCWHPPLGSLRELLMDSAQAYAWLSMHNSRFTEIVIYFNAACCAIVFRGGGLHTNPAAGRVLPVLQCNGPVHSQWCALLWFTVRPA